MDNYIAFNNWARHVEFAKVAGALQLHVGDVASPISLSWRVWGMYLSFKEL
jgi:hypothetical protein